MRVCDICQSNNIEKSRVQAIFLPLITDDKGHWVPSEDHELRELSGAKEICPDCFKNLIKLFKKGGESK